MQDDPATTDYKIVVRIKELLVDELKLYQVVILNGAGTFFGSSEPTPDIEEAVRDFERIHEHLELAVDIMVQNLGLNDKPFRPE